MWSVRPPEIDADSWRTSRRTTGLFIASSASRVTSDAEVVAGRVEAVGPRELRLAEAERLRALVHVLDERPAVASADVLGERDRAVVALWISAAATRSRRGSRSPARSRIVDPVTPTASGSTETIAPGLERSSATSTVISFVMLAIGSRSWARRASSTSPVCASSTR